MGHRRVGARARTFFGSFTASYTACAPVSPRRPASIHWRSKNKLSWVEHELYIICRPMSSLSWYANRFLRVRLPPCLCWINLSRSITQGAILAIIPPHCPWLGHPCQASRRVEIRSSVVCRLSIIGDLVQGHGYHRKIKLKTLQRKQILLMARWRGFVATLCAIKHEKINNCVIP